MAKLLLETHQAPLDPLNARRYSPLAVAVEAKRAPLAAYLMGKGASLDVPTVNLTALETLLEQVRATPPAAPAVQPGMAADAATPLHRAAGAGLTMVVQRLLEQGADANARDAEDVTPLHLAAAAGAVPVIEALLTARADPRAEDREGNTPLHRALLAGKDGTAVLLLRNGADPLREHPEGGTPLHLAVARHLPKTVIALLTAEVPVDALDRFERTPLMLAAERNDVELARLLLTRGANPALCARDGISVFGRAMPAVAALLLPPLPEYAVASRPEWTFLHKGAAEGKLPYVRTMMLASKAQANATDELGRTPLHVVSTAEGARVLIARGANVNAPDKEKRTPLLAALLRGNDDVARELLTAGAFVNLRDAADFSPLRIALQRKSAEMARALVEKGADVTEPILKQVTPVHLAVALDDEALMQALLTAKFAVAVRDPVCGAQPLHWAALRGQTAAMTLLFEQGAYVMVPDTQGCTPLHWAAASGQAKALSLLLERKAPRAAADNDGLTALDFARHYGWTEAVAVLAPEAAP